MGTDFHQRFFIIQFSIYCAQSLCKFLIPWAQIFTNIANTLFIMQLCSTIHLYSAHFLSKLSGTTEPGKRQRSIMLQKYVAQLHHVRIIIAQTSQLNEIPVLYFCPNICVNHICVFDSWGHGKCKLICKCNYTNPIIILFATKDRFQFCNFMREKRDRFNIPWNETNGTVPNIL